MPKIGVPTPSQQGWEADGTSGARKPAQRARVPKSTIEKRAEDRRAAPWFDAGVAAFGSATAYEEAAQIDKGDLSNMRKGDIAVALRRLLPMQDHAPSALAFCRAFLAEVVVAEHPDAVLELCTELLEEIGYFARPKKPDLTEGELALIVLRGILSDGSPVMRRLVENIAAQFGHGPNHVAMALHRDGDEK